MFPIDEGYIKYRIHWQSETPLAASFSPQIDELNIWRTEMYRRDWIGYAPELKVGFGNISTKLPSKSDKFIISGTQTGQIAHLGLSHYSLVNDYNIDSNQLWCEGETKASSESLTHAAIYELSEDYQAVIHIHCKEMWLKLLHKVPTTAIDVSYGTPQMAYEIQRLYREVNLDESKIVAMGGHEDGIISFGVNLKEAAQVLFDWS